MSPLYDPPDKRYQTRQYEAIPILKKLNDWMEKSQLTAPPKTAIGKALIYLNNQWDRLTGYVGDGRYPIDNNAVQCAIRPFAIGHKNWMFSKSQDGAKASANLYSLIETAKAKNLNAYDYLQCVFNALPNTQSVESEEALLPWNVSM